MSRSGSSRAAQNSMPPPSDTRPRRLKPASLSRNHARLPSNASLTNAPMAFPSFGGTDDTVLAPLPPARADFPKSRRSSTQSASRVKIRPLLKKASLSNEKPSIDLSRSAAENEGLGIYTSSINSSNVRRDAANGAGGRGYHTRTSSAVSQISTNTTSSVQRPGASYVHPMRQNPQSYTSPVPLSHQSSLTNLDDDEVAFPIPHLVGSANTPSQPHALLASKRSQPALQIRKSSSNNRLHSASQTTVSIPGTPSSLRPQEPFSPDNMPVTSRSSLESAFRLKRNRTNNVPIDPKDDFATVQALRAQFDAEQGLKAAKLEEAQARAADKEERRQRKKADQAQRKRTRSTATSEKSVPFSTVDYENTRALPVDEDLEYMRRDTMSPTEVHSETLNEKNGRRQGRPNTGKARSSKWNLFWFRFRTAWLKFQRGIGLRSRD